MFLVAGLMLCISFTTSGQWITIKNAAKSTVETTAAIGKKGYNSAQKAGKYLSDKLPSTTIHNQNYTLKSGTYTIRHKANGRYVDAHVEDKGYDFSVVTRTAQKNNTQQWTFKHLCNNVYTIQQVNTKRYMDAHEYAEKDFSIVTRTAQNNNTQFWVIKNISDDTYTIQQKSSGRYMDAHVEKGHDFSLVTRTAQKNNTQRWIIKCR